VYVSRFGKADKTTLTYECNFELDKDGIPYNYLDTALLPDQTPYDSSYNSYIKNLLRYFWDGEEVSTGTICTLKTHNVVQPGIYVLNMTSCPGETNWIKSGNTDPIINMSITLNGTTHENRTINTYWRMWGDILKFKYDDTNINFSPIWRSSNNTISGLTGPYNPLILIVRQPCTIKLEFTKHISG
jgi:hypothetical protein